MANIKMPAFKEDAEIIKLLRKKKLLVSRAIKFTTCYAHWGILQTIQKTIVL